MKTRFEVLRWRIWSGLDLMQLICQNPVPTAKIVPKKLKSSTKLLWFPFICFAIRGSITIHTVTLKPSRTGCSNMWGDKFLFSIGLRIRECWERTCSVFSQIYLPDTFLLASRRNLHVLILPSSITQYRENYHTSPKSAFGRWNPS